VPVRVVLVRPELPANVGAAARVIRNTGLSGLALVAPGDWRTLECWRTAWGAQDVLEQASVFADLASALRTTEVAYALTGRRGPGMAAVDVREAAAEVAVVDLRGEASLVFGPETTGLTLHELTLCGRRATIPSHPDQPSFNLSHAVAVAAYEVLRARGSAAAPRPRVAVHGEKAAMLSLLRAGLLNIGALPERETERHFEEWRALFHRVDLLPRERRLLEHAARKMSNARRGLRRDELGED
jgi:TrmH family RNA methyltransferase